MKHCYEYPRPMLTVGTLLLTKSSIIEVLLTQRKKNPFKRKSVIPGGFVDMDEDLKTAAQRELMEETGIELTNLQQFKTYGNPDPDPRGRTISVIYVAFLDHSIPGKGMDDAPQALIRHHQFT